jgi:hypothetical protein
MDRAPDDVVGLLALRAALTPIITDSPHSQVFWSHMLMLVSLYHALVFAFVDLFFGLCGAAILLGFYGLAWVFGAPWILLYATVIGLVGALAGGGLCFGGCLQDRDLKQQPGALTLGYLLSLVVTLGAVYRILHTGGLL